MPKKCDCCLETIAALDTINTTLVNQSAAASEIAPDQFVYAKLRNGGSSDMRVNGSVTPVDFEYVAVVPTIISRMNMYISAATIVLDDFGGLGTALPVGLLIQITDASDVIVLDFLDGDTITRNSDFVLMAGVDVDLDQLAGLTDDLIKIRFTITKAGAKLLLPTGYKFKVVVQDNLSTIPRMEAEVQGYLQQ